MAREGGQQHKTPKKSSQTDEEPEAQAGEDVAERKEKLDEDIDAILDDIDEVLESNADEFVRGFVQKGGE
jgi:ubiquitin-like protein Pup